MSREKYEIRWKDYYQVLEIEPDASIRTIRQAWRRLSQACHPDVAGSSKVNLARIKRLNEAYEVLSEQDRRATYDQAYQARNTESPEAAPARPARRRTPKSKTLPTPNSTSIPEPQLELEHEPILTPVPMPIPMPPASQQLQSEESTPDPPEPPELQMGLDEPTPEPAELQMGLEEPTPEPAERRHSLAGRTRLLAAAGAIGVLALITVGVMPGLLAGRDGPPAPQPTSFGSAVPAPQPALGSTSAYGASETTAQSDWPPEAPGDLLPQSTLTPTSPSVLWDSIPLMSPEAEAQGFRGFQVSGSPWTVSFSDQCQEAPCLRSGPIGGSGFSALSIAYADDLPAGVRAISFAVMAASPACCASFQVIGAAEPVTVNLPTDKSWTRVEVAVPETRPVVLKWVLVPGPSGVDEADAIWLDNIQFK